MFTSLVILVVLLCIIFGHQYVIALTDNVIENGSLLSSIEAVRFRRNTGAYVRSENEDAQSVEEELDDFLQNHCSGIEFSSDRGQHQPSSKEGGRDVEDQGEEHHLAIENDRKGINSNSICQESSSRVVHQSAPRPNDIKQNGGELNNSFWSSSALHTDTVGTDNKYKGNKEHILQALMDSIQKSTIVGATSFANTTLRAENVYNVVTEDFCEPNTNPFNRTFMEKCKSNINDQTKVLNEKTSHISRDNIPTNDESNSSSSSTVNKLDVIETTRVPKMDDDGKDKKVLEENGRKVM